MAIPQRFRAKRNHISGPIRTHKDRFWTSHSGFDAPSLGQVCNQLSEQLRRNCADLYHPADHLGLFLVVANLLFGFETAVGRRISLLF